MDQPIVAHFDRQQLLALYKSRVSLDPMRAPATQPYRRAFVWSAGIALGLIIGGNIYQPIAWFIPFGAVVLSLAIILLVYAFAHVWRARYIVHKWASDVEAQGPASISWGESGFSVAHAGKEHVATWSSITKLEVYDDHFIVRGGQELFFPKTSTTPEQFDYLVDLFKRKTLHTSPVTGS